MAKDEGALVSINSDAHGTDGFDALRYAIAQTRRGWLEKKGRAQHEAARETAEARRVPPRSTATIALVPRARGFFGATGSRGIRFDPALADGGIVRGFLTNGF